MPSEPQIKMLSNKTRNRFFVALFLVFLIALPAFIFYTSGYRLDFSNKEGAIITTGGIYITTDDLEVAVFLDGEYIERPRLFRSAYYIQNISAGQHRVVVQQEGLHTWVKELPVDSHIVTEATAFNMPLEPRIRPIAEYITNNGTGVFFAASTTIDLFPEATTTTDYIILRGAGTTTLSRSTEYLFVTDLFDTSPKELEEEELSNRFLPDLDPTLSSTTSTTTPLYPFIEKDNMLIEERGEELFAVWAGEPENVPYYFCVTGTASSSIAKRYGEHVAEQLAVKQSLITDPLLIDDNRFCRDEIKLDRKRQEVLYYSFFPDGRDLVVLQLEDGLYVTEIDDRAWQNTQKIYDGVDFTTRVTDDAIYIKQNERYFELLTTIEN